MRAAMVSIEPTAASNETTPVVALAAPSELSVDIEYLTVSTRPRRCVGPYAICMAQLLKGLSSKCKRSEGNRSLVDVCELKSEKAF